MLITILKWEKNVLVNENSLESRKMRWNNSTWKISIESSMKATTHLTITMTRCVYELLEISITHPRKASSQIINNCTSIISKQAVEDQRPEKLLTMLRMSTLFKLRRRWWWEEKYENEMLSGSWGSKVNIFYNLSKAFFLVLTSINILWK